MIAQVAEKTAAVKLKGLDDKNVKFNLILTEMYTQKSPHLILIKNTETNKIENKIFTVNQNVALLFSSYS